jgi:hypothetical protein
MASLPTTTIAGLQLPKIIVGTNSLLGWSHTSSGRDEWIRRTYTAERVAEVLLHCASLGATAVVGPLLPRLTDALAIARAVDPRITWVSTTIGTSKETFREQLAEIKAAGSPICFLHGGWTDKWPVVDGRLDGMERCIEEIRKAGIIPGTAVHNGERLAMVTRLGYDFDAYLVPVNQAGFAMRPDRATMLAAVASAGKPVIAIKPLACGRFEENKPGDWLRWTLDQAGVVATAVGVMSEEEASEDIAAAREILAVPAGR